MSNPLLLFYRPPWLLEQDTVNKALTFYERTIIANYQTVYPAESPLSFLEPPRQEDALAKMAKIIDEMLSSIWT